MPHDINDEQWQEIESHLFAGRKIQAIKLFREHTGEGLKDAKEVLEEHEAKLRDEFPDKFEHEEGSGCMVRVGVFMLTALVGIYCLLP